MYTENGRSEIKQQNNTVMTGGIPDTASIGRRKDRKKKKQKVTIRRHISCSEYHPIENDQNIRPLTPSGSRRSNLPLMPGLRPSEHGKQSHALARPELSPRSPATPTGNSLGGKHPTRRLKHKPLCNAHNTIAPPQPSAECHDPARGGPRPRSRARGARSTKGL